MSFASQALTEKWLFADVSQAQAVGQTPLSASHRLPHLTSLYPGELGIREPEV